MIIHKGKDGSIAIMILAPGADKVEAIEKFKNAHPDGFYTEHYEGEFKLPEDRLFRDAWTLKNNKVVIHEQKAKDIHLKRIREVRNKELDKLDKEHLKNLTVPGMIVEIDSKKQVLRDLPAKINSLDWPDELPKHEDYK